MVATCRGNLRQTLIHVTGFRTLCQWNLDSGFPTLVRVFQIPWAVFWIPKSRISVHKQKFHRFRNPESLAWSVDGATARRLVNSVFGLRVFWVQDLWSQKSWALESGIQLKESAIPLTIGIWNPSSLTRIPSRIQYSSPESTAWNRESKTLLHYLSWSERYCCWYTVQSV